LASIPLLALACFGALGWHVLRLKRESISSFLGHPALIAMVALLGMALVEPFLPAQATTRYAFFIYPFMILALVMACYQAVRGLPTAALSANGQILSAAVLSMGFFFLSEDFQVRQLLNVNDPEVVFRTGKFARLKEHWFWRHDDRSPGQFLKEHKAEADGVIVSFMARTLPYYLGREVNYAIFCSRHDQSKNWYYWFIARDKGKIELWTGRPLLGTDDEVREFTKNLKSVHLVRLADPKFSDLQNVERIWSGRLGACQRVYLSPYGRLEILHLRLDRGTNE
jgi:hypothetical protein